MTINHNPQIILFNTASRSKEVFKPIDSKKVGMYTCGPTVYNYPHIGNLRAYVFEDVLKRTLTLGGYTVFHVMNITDVGHLTSDSDTGDDKMEKGAAREGKSVWDIARFYTDIFKTHIAALNIISPNIWCPATEHILEQIEQIEELERKGFTYEIRDGVYFDTSKFPKYSEFARLKLDELKAGARVEMVEGKRNPTDFALWKFSPTNGSKRQMEWDSPWGVGFPGWHIECSAMSIKYLGSHFDIHCGGIDHVPVHHTNEIAQAECATGNHPWVNYWLHNEFLNVTDGSKMAKSSGNFLHLGVLIEKGYDPLCYRYLLLQTHYRKQMMFSMDSLDAAKAGYIRLREKTASLAFEKAAPLQSTGQTYLSQFKEAVFDDMNTPAALAVLQTMMADVALAVGEKRTLIDAFDSIFALDLLKPFKGTDVPADVQALLDQRSVARASKNFVESDRLRDAILALGFVVKDSKDGQTVTKK